MRLFSDSPKVTTIVLNGHEIVVPRARLGKHLLLEQIAREDPTPQTIREYLRLCEVSEEAPGIEMLTAYLQLREMNQMTADIPLIKENASDQKKNAWDYPQRFAAVWMHTLASAYGWSREDILDLDIDEALCYLQEILVEDYFAKEFDNSLSPNSFKHDGKGKAEYVPITKPFWMTPKQPQQNRNRTLKSVIPPGATWQSMIQKPKNQ